MLIYLQRIKKNNKQTHFTTLAFELINVIKKEKGRLLLFKFEQ